MRYAHVSIDLCADVPNPFVVRVSMMQAADLRISLTPQATPPPVNKQATVSFSFCVYVRSYVYWCLLSFLCCVASSHSTSKLAFFPDHRLEMSLSARCRSLGCAADDACERRQEGPARRACTALVVLPLLRELLVFESVCS